MSKRCVRHLWLMLIVLITCQPAWAHYMDIAQFTFVEGQQAGRFHLEVGNLPQSRYPDQPVAWPRGCTVLSREEIAGASPRVDFEIDCGEASGGSIQTRWGQDGALVEWHDKDGASVSAMLPGSRQGAVIELPDWEAGPPDPQGFWNTAWRYLVLGTEHVLAGWDHLAFVFCLSMLASGGALLWLITSFTLGHSVSLALSHLGVVNIPIAPVEAIIALSVIFMAREALLQQRGKPLLGRYPKASGAAPAPSVSQRGRLWLTAGFGLVHGLGFASVLGSLGVSPSETVAALAFFNIGVEVGQVFFVLAVLATVSAIRVIHLDRTMVRAAICGVGAMGVLWTLQRVAAI